MRAGVLASQIRVDAIIVSAQRMTEVNFTKMLLEASSRCLSQ